MNRREFIKNSAALAAAAASATTTPAVLANTWPTKPIRLMVGFPAGGGADAMARLIADRLGAKLGQSVIVENKTGATGTICSEFVSKAVPDGYTLQLVHPNSNVVGPLMVAKGKFDPINDFTPISLLAVTPQLLVVNSKVPAKNIKELIAHAKANPGKLTFISSGVGSVQHLAGEAFKLAANVDMLHVPFKGTGEAMTALLSGECDMSFSSIGSALPQVKSSRLRLIAACSEKRLKTMPEVPVIAELLTGFEFETWYGLAGPAKLPNAITSRIQKELPGILASLEVNKRMNELDAEVSTSLSGETLAKFWKAELDKYRKLIDSAKITAA
jgi:tripartite-type tricarboxylate transporter receptor subunit TctC